MSDKGRTKQKKNNKISETKSSEDSEVGSGFEIGSDLEDSEVYTKLVKAKVKVSDFEISSEPKKTKLSDSENSDLENSDSENSDLENSDLENSDLENSDLENSDLEMNTYIKPKKKTNNVVPVKKADSVKKSSKNKKLTRRGRSRPSSGKIIIIRDGKTLKWCTNPEHANYCPIENFHYANKKKGILMAECGDCRNKYKRGRSKEVYQKELTKVYVYDETKKCTGVCGEILPIEMFWFKHTTTGQRDSRCKTCRNLEKSKQPEYKAQYFQTWYYEKGGKEKCQILWELYKPIRNQRNRERRKTDIHYRTKEIIRTRIYECLKAKDINKENKVRYIGIDIPTYLVWIAYQFDKYMTWKNQGTYWQIDHVRPCDSFNFTSDNDDTIYECFHWSNTRPMEKTSNTIKSCKIDNELIKEHIEIAKNFMIEYGVENDNIISIEENEVIEI